MLISFFWRSVAVLKVSLHGANEYANKVSQVEEVLFLFGDRIGTPLMEILAEVQALPLEIIGASIYQH